MDELRLVRREDRTLIVATDAGEEFKLIVDDTMLAEVRQLSRRQIEPSKASPREIQALVRAGKTRTEIAEFFDVEEASIERYEEPVLAERRYILERAQGVPVRTINEDDEEQQFGVVLAERLISLAAEGVTWNSWRDEEAGWMISLEFVSHDIDHRAIWSFDHRKSVLAPITADAVTLSKQGDVGDRLIPKLRAVDDLRQSERFDSGAFDPEQLANELALDNDETATPESAEAPAAPSGRVSPDHPSTGSIPIINMDSEATRRRNIEELAVKTPEPELPDLGQTADLLDALRRRRGERDSGIKLDSDAAPEAQPTPPVQLPGFQDHDLGTPHDSSGSGSSRSGEAEPGDPSAAGETRRGKRRPQIPSWDDILFGTRSEEDPN